MLDVIDFECCLYDICNAFVAAVGERCLLASLINGRRISEL